jgi:tetratricopeptide (TPR) repeat protein
MKTKQNPQEMADQAQKIYLSGDFMTAAQAFADAASSFESAGDLLQSAEMQNNRSVALLRARQPQMALDAVRGTDKVFSTAGDLRRQGIALANQAGALEALKKPKEAIAAYKKAGDVLEKAGEGDMHAEVMQLLSMLYFRRFKFYDAIIALQSGLAGVKNPTSKQKMMKRILKFHL